MRWKKDANKHNVKLEDFKEIKLDTNAFYINYFFILKSLQFLELIIVNVKFKNPMVRNDTENWIICIKYWHTHKHTHTHKHSSFNIVNVNCKVFLTVTLKLGH